MEMQLAGISNNIKTVQTVYAAFLNHDFNVVLAALSEDVEWGEPSNPFNPCGGTKHGHEGFLEWLQIGRDSEEILVLEPKKFLTDNDSVAVVGFTKCLARATNKIYETDFVHLFTFRENKIIRFQEFFDTYIAGEAFRT
jgi:hypothetical protein